MQEGILHDFSSWGRQDTGTTPVRGGPEDGPPEHLTQI